MSASDIQAAVAAARPHLPRLAAGYADRAVASGKMLAEVQSDLLAQMTNEPRAAGRASMVAEARRQGRIVPEPAAEGIAAAASAGALGTRAASLENMKALVRQAGMAPKG